MQLVKIFFKEPDYYIHGTDNLDSIGTSSSHGCLRLDPVDAAELAIRVMESSGAKKDSTWYQNAIEKGQTRTVILPQKSRNDHHAADPQSPQFAKKKGAPKRPLFLLLVHPAHAAWRATATGVVVVRRLLLLDDQCFGREQKSRDRRRVLQRSPRDLRRIDDTSLDQILVLSVSAL